MASIKYMAPVASVALLLLSSGPAQGEIYKSVDKNGHVTYSNTPSRGAIRLNLDTPAPSAKKPRSAVSPSDFPRIDSQTQKQRDQTRREVLNDELSAEMKLLDQAKKDLTAAQQTPKPTGGYQEHLQALKDNVTLHQKNIDAINKELGNLR